MTAPLLTNEAIRATLDRQRLKHGETFAALSRMIRRDVRYLQRFVRHGSPKRLDDREIETLAAYFRIDPRLLGGKKAPRARSGQVPRLEPHYRPITFR